MLEKQLLLTSLIAR